MDKPDFHPESLMMSYGYRPEWSEGALKCPIFQTSTFVFKTAEEGKAHFELAYGLRQPNKGEQVGLIYSRINNPDLEILEDRLGLWDQADDCAVFESGMSAITTILLEFLQPGDVILHTNPLYGGTDQFISEILPKYGISSLEWNRQDTYDALQQRLEKALQGKRLGIIYIETPANPTNTLYDIEWGKRLAEHFSSDNHKPVVVVDNTYLGPLWQHPLKHGADLVAYSATKYIGGHSDVIAGAVSGKAEYMQRVKVLRTFLGNMAGPWTGWLLLRSLETLQLRMERQAKNARVVAEFLREHPKVEKVHYLGFLSEEHEPQQYAIFRKQCSSTGAMLSFDVKGGEAAAFRMLNSLKLVKLAVSLGSTESLAQHPATMTHAGVPAQRKAEMGITDKMIRLSVGVEHPDDLIWDLKQALEQVDR